MHARPICRLVLASCLAAVFLVCGCASKPKEIPSSSADSPAPLAIAPQAPIAPADPSDMAARTPDLLAEQAAAYAQKLEQALADRSAPDTVDKSEAEAAAERTSATTQPTEPQPSDPAIDPPAEISVSPSTELADSAHPADPDPADTQPESSLPLATDELVRQLAQRTRETPSDLAAHLDYQLLLFLREQKVPQMNEIASLPAEDRELLAALLDSLTVLRSNLRRDNDMLQPAKIQPLLELAARLRTQADLVISTVALCKKVVTFGVYEPVEPEFAAGAEHAVIVYCEVENFASQLNEKKLWETRLKQEIVLYTEGGLPVWQHKTRTVTDLSRNRRRDFFVVDMIKLPANLTIGRYLLKVSLVDLNANRIAEATVPVAIVAREARAD